MSATATTKASNSKLVWIESDDNGKPYYTTECGRYMVYTRHGKWVPSFWNRLLSPAEWDFCRKVAGKGNTPMDYNELQQALCATEDFHFSKTGTKISESNRGDFEEPVKEDKPKKKVHSNPVESEKKTEPSTTQESETVSTATEPTVEPLTIDRDEAVTLCQELGWATADKWGPKRMKKALKSLKKVMKEGDISPSTPESGCLADEIFSKLEEGGKLVLEGDYPEEQETTPEASSNGDGHSDEEKPAPKKRGRKPGSGKPKAEKVPKEKKAKKEQPAPEPVDNQAVLDLCHPEELSLEELNVDRSYQRGVVDTHVKKMLKDFRPYALGCLIAGQREDDTYWTVDGVQRSEVLRRKGYKSYHFMVFKSDGPRHEAEIFGCINAKRKGLLKTEQFSADLTAEQEEATSINKIVTEAGFELGKATAWPKLDCVMALRKIYRKGGEELLTKTLSTLNEAWDGNREACREFIVFGVADFMSKYKDLYDHSRFVEVLSKIDPTRLMSDIKSAKQLLGGSRHLALGQSLLTNYNKGIKSKSKVLPNKYLGSEEEDNGPRS